MEAAGTKLLEIIDSIDRTKVVKSEIEYIHVEFRSRIFRFVDDVEFYFDDKNKLMHFRSASRIGYSDLGANRKRMLGIIKMFND